jgi:hypothetical protein
MVMSKQSSGATGVYVLRPSGRSSTSSDHEDGQSVPPDDGVADINGHCRHSSLPSATSAILRQRPGHCQEAQRPNAARGRNASLPLDGARAKTRDQLSVGPAGSRAPRDAPPRPTSGPAPPGARSCLQRAVAGSLANQPGQLADGEKQGSPVVNTPIRYTFPTCCA